MAADDLADMSLEDLMNLTVTSASKREERLVDAAAAITVLTQEDIRRSGATSIPEALRMVPGLNVARIDSSRWAISARGYNGQFANKLLVLMDGRVVYSPLFGGVYWDVQDTVMADIERIEVIRGPGGTLWGANAVNGVINITTKSAADTQGVHAMGLAGNQEYVGEGRFGGKVGEKTSYRVFGRGFKRKDFTFPEGSGFTPHDEWWQWRVGARIDSDPTENDNVTLQGEFYDGKKEVADGSLAPSPVDADTRGGNVITRWNHKISDRQSTEVQAFYDYTSRQENQFVEVRNTVDVLVQHDFILGAQDQWLFNWGAEYMWTGDNVVNAGLITFDPTDENFHRASGFLQAQWNLFDGALEVIGGSKLEWNSYTGFEYQPTGRLLWKFIEGNVFWAAVSRAVHSPTRIDRDLSFGGLVEGNKNIDSERLIAYEFGYRNYMFETVSVDLSLFYNDYGEMAALTGAAPATFTNSLASQAWGGELELGWQAMRDLRFITSYAYLGVKDAPDPGASQIFGSNDGTSPQHTWMLRGLWNVPVVPVELDSTVWYVSKLPGWITATGGSVPSYWRLDARIGWQPLEWLGLDFVGQNLTDTLHAEYGEGAAIPVFPGNWVPRSYYGRVTLTF